MKSSKDPIFTNAQQQLNTVKIRNYFEGAGPDYETWSKDFNMHFGYWRCGMNPFKRENMLNQMTTEVYRRLSLNQPNKSIVDLGCGLGASMRHLSALNPKLNIEGITLVPWQIKMGQNMTSSKKVGFHLGDFTQTLFGDECFDGAYAIESACYAKGNDKKDFIAEAYRILKPNAKLVIADGFLKNPHLPFSSSAKKAYRHLCEAWAIPELAQIDAFENRLKQTGFKHVKIEDVSWNVAPSTAHSPLLIIKFLLKKIWQGEKIEQQSWNNLKGVFLTNVLGLLRRKFSYYLITAEK